VRPATEDWTAFFHIAPRANSAELVGQLDHAITDREYPPPVWSAKSGLQALCICHLLRVSNLCEHLTEAVFDRRYWLVGDSRKWYLTIVGAGCALPTRIGA